MSARPSPWFVELLAESRALRTQMSYARYRLAWLVGRYEKPGSIPVAEIERLLSERWPVTTDTEPPKE